MSARVPTAVPSYEIAASSDGPLIEDIEGPIRFAGAGHGPVTVMKTSTRLRPPTGA